MPRRRFILAGEVRGALVAEIKVTVELPAETAVLVNKFLLLNQRPPGHGPMTVEKLVTMLLEDVAAAERDNTTWQGGHMALALSEHGYRT